MQAPCIYPIATSPEERDKGARDVAFPTIGPPSVLTGDGLSDAMHDDLHGNEDNDANQVLASVRWKGEERAQARKVLMMDMGDRRSDERVEPPEPKGNILW